jgi:glutamate dehydrogenase (NADP+)
MTKEVGANLDFLDNLRQQYAHQPTFLQAVEEMALSLTDLFDDPINGDFYRRSFSLMAEPERTLAFRVPWMDDQGKLQYNRGWRVEFNR